MKLKDLLQNLPGSSSRGSLEVEVKGISCHSAQVLPGHLFVAIPGARQDGSSYISEAIDRGAVGLVVKNYFTAFNHQLPQVLVPDPRAALAILANEFYQHPSRDLKLIGVTGTNGKTTVAFLGRAILEEAGWRTGLLGTIKYQIGDRCLPSELTTPAPPRLQQLLQEMKKAGCTHAVMEVSSHALKQDRVLGLQFQAAIFTNLSREHLDYHPTWSDYRDSKIRLFQALHLGSQEGENRKAIVNLDDPVSKAIIKQAQTEVLTYGFKNGAALRAEDPRLTREGTTFQVRFEGKSYPARIRLLGRYNIYNALAAIALGFSAGLPPEIILGALQKVAAIPGRLEAVDGGQNFRVLIDYAHTPDALEKVLQAVKEVYPGKLTVVFGCGGDRDRSKRPLMGLVASRQADEVIVTSDNPRSEDPEAIIKEILSPLRRRGGRIRSITDRRQAISEAFSRAKAGEVVLIAGKGHERQQIFRDYIIPFDDREVALELLKLNRQAGGLI